MRKVFGFLIILVLAIAASLGRIYYHTTDFDALTRQKPDKTAEPRYIFINKAPGIEWNVAHPESFTEAGFREILDTVQPPENPALLLGVTHVFDIFRADIPTLTESLRRFLAASEATGMPVLVCFDGQNWWEQRPDLWNWWDPEQPGYDPDNARNVEWTGWDPSHAVKIGWRNWGSQIRVAPAPNIASPEVIEAHLERLEVLVPIVVEWYRALPETKKELLGGVKFGHEAGIGVNAYHYPDGNQYLGQDAANDPKQSYDPKQGWQGGLAMIGYAAVKTAGIKTEGTLTRDDIAEVTRRYLEVLCKTAHQAGLPQHLTYTHQGGTYAPWDKHIPFSAACNDYATPGYSFYFTDPHDAKGLQEVLGEERRWAAVEWWWAAKDAAGWRHHFERTLNFENCRMIAIFNWNCGFKFKEEAGGLEALRELLQDWREN